MAFYKMPSFSLGKSIDINNWTAINSSVIPYYDSRCSYNTENNVMNAWGYSEYAGTDFFEHVTFKSESISECSGYTLNCNFTGAGKGVYYIQLVNETTGTTVYLNHIDSVAITTDDTYSIHVYIEAGATGVSGQQTYTVTCNELSLT